MSDKLDIESIRDTEFPLTSEWIYLNHAAVGPIPKSVFETQEEFDRTKLYGNALWNIEQIIEEVKKARELVARFINSKPHEIAFLHNTSNGLSMVADGYIWHRVRELGQEQGNIVITDLEYTSNSYPWQVQAKRHGLELRVVKNIDGELPVEAFPVDENTIVVAVSHVQFANGFKTDIGELAKVCHEHGSKLAVDGIQSAGNTVIDAGKLDFDFFATGGYKWLLGPFNSGFLFCKENLLSEVSPSLVGSQSAIDPLNFSHHEFIYAKSAQRFQPSMISMTLPFARTIGFLESIGMDRIEKRIKKLTSVLVQTVDDIDRFTVERPGTEKEWSGIVRITAPHSSPEDIKQAVEKLSSDHKIAVSFREGGVRISPHFYNTADEMTQMVNKLSEIL
ncbi:MAG: aminotransferase class V-fold PLP-dependent enzyme [Candidatus Hodarchaeales archaeon]